MHQPLKSLSLVMATLLLSVASPLQFTGTTFRISRATAQAQTTQDRKAEADRLLNQGIEQLNAGQREVALQSLQQALTLYQEIQDRYGEGQVLRNLGNLYFLQKDYTKAIEYQQQALAIAREIKDRDLEARALFNIGSAYKELGESAKAIDYSQQSLAIAQDIQNREVEWKAFNNLGLVYTALKDYTKAIEYQQQVLVIARELQDDDLEWSALSALVGSYDSLKDYQKAIELAQQGLTLALKTQNLDWELAVRTTLAQIHNVIAINAFSTGDSALLEQASQRAIQMAQVGLNLAKKLNKPMDEAWSLLQLGDAYKRIANYSESLTAYEQGLAIYQSLGKKPDQLNSLIQIMGIHLLIGRSASEQRDDLGSFNQANKVLALSSEALQLAKEVNNPEYEKQVLERQSNAYSNIGDYYVRLRDFGKAEQAAQLSRDIAQKSENWQAETGALSLLRLIYSSRGEYRKQIEIVQRSLELSQKRNSPESEVYALLNLAGDYQVFGNLPKSIEVAQQALSKAQAIDVTKFSLRIRPHILRMPSEALHLLTFAHQHLGEYDKALEFAQQRLRVSRAIANPTEEIQALMVLGQIYASRQEWQPAIASTQQAWELAKSTENSSNPSQAALEIKALAQLTQLYAAQENHPKALELAQQALKIAQQSNQPELELNALDALSKAYAAQGNVPKALELLQQQVALNPKLPNPANRSSSLVTLGGAYMELGDYQTSRQLLEQALAEAQSIQYTPSEALAWHLLAAVAFAEGEPQKAVELAEKGIAVAQEQVPLLEMVANLTLSIAYGEIGNEQKAMQATQASLAITRQLQNPDFEKSTLILLGNLHRKFGRPQEAIAAYQAALATGKTTSGVFGKGYAIYAGLGRTYAELNQPNVAITFYKKAINGIEEVRRNLQGLSPQLQQSFLQTTVDFDQLKTAGIYRQLADLLLSQGRILEAQQVLELLKVQEIRDYTTDRRAGGETTEVVLNSIEEDILKEFGSLIGFGQKVIECEDTSCSQLNQLQDQLDGLTEHFNQTVQTIEEKIRDRISKDPGTLDSEDFLRKANEIVEAQPGTVLIYPLVLEDKIWLLWAAEGGIVKSIPVSNVGQRQLGETVLKFRQLLQNPSSDIAELQATGKQLYDWLIKPLESELKANNIQHLVFSLDRAARYIPMSTLFDGEKYLIENYTVSTVLSADLTNLDKRLPPGTQNTSVLAMGLSDAVAGFNPLPNVPPELDAIVLTTDNDPAGVYSGNEFLNNEFSLETLRKNLRGRQILHLATHGEFNPGRPEESYLVLGTGEKFAIPEISKLYRQLSDVHLVVLSACETALGGANADGNEINGISYYFLNHGAEAVMASLWLVNDGSTSQLMQNFYKNLAQGTEQAPITKAQALRQAQLKMLSGEAATSENADPRAGIALIPRTNSSDRIIPGFSHPYYWAPFVLIGNGL